MDLSLDIVRLHSVKEALCRFFQPEVLDGDNKYRCNQCKKLSPARKQMAVYRAPNVLVIQLKRFENIFGGKIDRHVLFEERLGLEGHMCRASKNARPEYVLYGVVVHAGHSQDAGHYYAYVKDASGRWFCCNDASVSPVNTQSVLAEKAYMLFYVRTSAGPKICKETVAPCGAWTPSPPVTPDTGPSESQKKSGLSTAHPGPLFGNSTNTSGNGRGTTSPQMKLGGTVAFNGGKSGLVGNGSHYKLEPLVNGKSVTKDHTCRQSDSMSNGLAVDDQSASFNSDSIKGDEILPIYGPNLPLLPLSTPAEGLRSAYQAVTVVSTTQSVIPEDPSQVCKQTESTLNHSLGDGPLPATENANGGTVTSSHAKAITLSASALLSQGASSLGSGHVLSKEEMQTPELLGNNKEIECRVEAEVVHQKTLLEGERVFCRKRLQKEVCSSFSTNGHEEKREGVAPNVDTDERHGSMDVEQLSELEKLKILLEKEGREELQRSGWCDAVRESMQAAKKRRLLPRDLTEKAHLRKQLIVEVQGSLKLQVPRELKEHLVEQLRAFFAPKDC